MKRVRMHVKVLTNRTIQNTKNTEKLDCNTPSLDDMFKYCSKNIFYLGVFMTIIILMIIILKILCKFI